DLAAAMAEEERAQQAVTGALALMQEADAAAAAVSGQLGRLAGAARAAQDEATRLAAAIDAAREKSGRDQAAPTEPSAPLAAAAVSERQAARAAAQRGRLRQQQARIAGAVAQGAGMALERLEGSLAVATAERQAAEQAREGRSDALKALRVQVRELTEELDRVVDSAHGAEIVRAEHRMRLE